MELEEMLEEAPKPVEPKELKIEEEVEEMEAAKEEAVEKAVKIKTFRIGSHEVVEELREGEEVSYITCVRCGLTVRLEEVSRFSEAKCIGGAQVAEQAREKAEMSRCGYCGKAAVGSYPAEYVDNNPIEVPLCQQCMGKIEEAYLKMRPNIMGLSRKSRVRCRHPLENTRTVAWHHYTATWYVMDENGRWPCPACGMVFDRLLEAVKHFTEKHPELPSKAGREYVRGLGEVSRTWQGYYCPVCGLLCDSEATLKDHYKGHGGG
jgi:uncharacterized C2H2 Zn-finger protein